jgi:hypothetical protein
MGLKVRFNLRFVLFAVVPYFAVLGSVKPIVEGMIENDVILKGTPTLEHISWKQYLSGLALIGYALSMCYWMTLLFACVYIPWLRNWITKKGSDGDRTELDSREESNLES